MPFSPQSRFVAHKTPPRFPGKCACCGSATKPVIEFGLSIGFTTPENNEYGEVYLCFDCVVEAAVGTDRVVSVTDYESVIEELKSATASQMPFLDAMKEFNERQRAIYADFDTAIANAHSATSVSGPEAEGTSAADESDAGKPVETSGQEHRTTRNKRTASVSSSSGNDSGDVFSL